MDDARKSLTMGFVVMPVQANHYGNVHGGEILKEADNLAYALASRFSRMNVVTARVEELNFRAPVKIGDLVMLTALIEKVGRSSMRLQVRIQGEHLKSGEVFDVADAYFTMVAVDESGKPVEIPQTAR